MNEACVYHVWRVYQNAIRVERVGRTYVTQSDLVATYCNEQEAISAAQELINGHHTAMTGSKIQDVTGRGPTVYEREPGCLYVWSQRVWHEDITRRLLVNVSADPLLGTPLIGLAEQAE